MFQPLRSNVVLLVPLVLLALSAALNAADSADAVRQHVHEPNFLTKLCVHQEYDEVISGSPQGFLPWLQDESLPLSARFYVATRVAGSQGITNGEYSRIAGWLWNLLRERSSVDAASVLVYYWRSIPAEISDEELFAQMQADGWRIGRQLYATLINQKTRDTKPSRNLSIIIPRPAWLAHDAAGAGGGR